MTNQILPMGKVYETDIEGFIINEASADMIQPPWTSVVEDVKDSYLNNWQKIHSIYIRGSIARGSGVEGISDVDTLAVVYGDKKDLDHSWVLNFKQEMLEKYPFCLDVELKCVPLNRLLNLEDEYCHTLRMIVQITAVCIWGDDVRPLLPKFKPGRETMKCALVLSDNIDRLINWREQYKFTPRSCQWIMKRILRSGFEIVMAEANCYTRDLYPCWQIFSRYYPEKREQMKQALHWAINPTDDHTEILSFLQDFGGWLVARVQQLET